MNIRKPYLIAETGSNHNGDNNIAIKIIKNVKICSFDSVKFQKTTVEIVKDYYKKNENI